MSALLARPLRAWQRQALSRYRTNSLASNNFLLVATPGAGKTTFGLVVAAELLASGVVEQVLIVAPTRHLKLQWTASAAERGLRINAAHVSGSDIQGAGQGAVVTYAQIAAAPEQFAEQVARRPTLVLLDEVHHAGDSKSWGSALLTACGPAVRRLLMTGTPFRSDDARVPFVSYRRRRWGGYRSRPDFVYGYGEALADRVVRPVVFAAYGGQALWQEGDEGFQATLGAELVDERVMRRAWRTVLDPKGRWMPSVLRAAHEQLMVVRGSMPDAGGLVIAHSQRSARAYAAMLAAITGVEPTVALSNDPEASAKIARFATAPDGLWLVAVRMVSEGVDIPRLAVGVYATTYSTPLFFAQAVGRFVRARRSGEVATVFLPAVPVLLELAGQITRLRAHEVSGVGVIEGERATSTRRAPVGRLLVLFVALDSWADFYRVIGLRGVWRGDARRAMVNGVAAALAREHGEDNRNAA